MPSSPPTASSTWGLWRDPRGRIATNLAIDKPRQHSGSASGRLDLVPLEPLELIPTQNVREDEPNLPFWRTFRSRSAKFGVYWYRQVFGNIRRIEPEVMSASA